MNFNILIDEFLNDTDQDTQPQPLLLLPQPQPQPLLPLMESRDILKDVKEKIKNRIQKDNSKFTSDSICKTLGQEGLQELKDFTSYLGIHFSKDVRKRELCVLIANELYAPVKECDSTESNSKKCCLPDDINVNLDPIVGLPRWRVFKYEDRCYDLKDLYNINKSGSGSGIIRDPYTNKVLPSRKIMLEFQKLNELSNQDLEEMFKDSLTEEIKDVIEIKGQGNIEIDPIRKEWNKLNELFPYSLNGDNFLKISFIELISLVQEIMKYDIQINTTFFEDLIYYPGTKDEKLSRFIKILYNHAQLDPNISMQLYVILGETSIFKNSYQEIQPIYTDDPQDTFSDVELDDIDTPDSGWGNV